MGAGRHLLRWGLVTLLAVGAAVVFYFIRPFQPVNRPTLIDRASLSCGEVLLTQTFTGTTEPYVVSLYFRANGSRSWSEYYVDHDSPFWRGKLKVSPSRDSCELVFYGSRFGEFSCRELVVERPGRSYPPKAVIAEPLERVFDASASPMDVGATSNDLNGYPWERN
jgi:hypothetical protein